MSDATAKRHTSRIAPPAIHTKATVTSDLHSGASYWADGQWIIPVPDQAVHP